MVDCVWLDSEDKMILLHQNKLNAYVFFRDTFTGNMELETFYKYLWREKRNEDRNFRLPRFQSSYIYWDHLDKKWDFIDAFTYWNDRLVDSHASEKLFNFKLVKDKNLTVLELNNVTEEGRWDISETWNSFSKRMIIENIFEVPKARRAHLILDEPKIPLTLLAVFIDTSTLYGAMIAGLFWNFL